MHDMCCIREKSGYRDRGIDRERAREGGRERKSERGRGWC